MPTVRHWPWPSKETDSKVSYILDALRKSDAQRRLGQPPDLNNPGAAAPPAPRARPRRWLPVLGIAVVLVAAILIGRGFSPVQQWLAGSDERGAPTEQPLDSEPIPLPPGQLESAEAVADAAAGEAEPPRAERSPVPVAPPVTVMSRPAPERARDRPAPPRERPAPAQDRSPPTLVQERERLVQDAREVRRMAEAAQTTVTPAPAPDTASASVMPPPEEPAEPWTPERSEFLRQWELPLSVRRDLPDLRLSIHVFSTQPQDRFVLINGERRIEGDDLGRGASLVEIRREGALVRFRDYSFLLEP